MMEKGEAIIVHVDPDLQDLIPEFLSARHKDVEALQTALAGGDFENIRIIGHSMKGTGGGYGFDAITDMGAALERAAKASDAQEITRVTAELAAYLARVQVAFDGVS